MNEPVKLTEWGWFIVSNLCLSDLGVKELHKHFSTTQVMVWRMEANYEKFLLDDGDPHEYDIRKLTNNLLN